MSARSKSVFATSGGAAGIN